MSIHCDGYLRAALTRSRRVSKPRSRRLQRLVPEVLEDRQLLATFTVTNLLNSGTGSLRWAIVAANAQPGPNTVDFSVAGTIPVSRTPLPALSGRMMIDGTSAPGYAGVPVVTINFHGSRGLTFNGGSSGSVLRGLALVGAGTAGVTLNAGSITLQGNDIGILPDGRAAGNLGDGVRINASSTGDLIGQTAADTVSAGLMASLQVSASFQLSNVISGNRGNGIGIYGGASNQIAMNYIGTDASGTLNRGNGASGILMTQGAAGNLIGGEATGGNDPTAGVFVRPPEGNLISGNGAAGVLITGGATQNQLSGNFIGTTANGNAALGNRCDGVAIQGASGNALIGCRIQQDPFVFYNVISGNGGNGLRITNSNNTTVQANFLGAGANNATVVANRGDGLLVSGTSANTQVGGVIPLGNVIAGNAMNGIEVRDRASGFISFNTFAGLFAFSTSAPNRRDGILITATGGNNVVRTSVVSGNLGNGIEIGGYATGVQVTETAVGTNTAIQTALPNGGDGILITGHAHNNAIGGFQPSIEPQVTVSANNRYGIEIAGQAHDNVIFHTRIGTSALGTGNLGNLLGGITLGSGTSATTIGGSSSALQNLIRYNSGNGVTLRSSRVARILGNSILNNQSYGLRATGNCAGSLLQGNTIAGNGAGNVNLSGSRGVVYTS